MIRELPESEGRCLAFEISARVSAEEEREWLLKIEEALKIHDRVSVLVVLTEQAGWGVKAGLEDLKWVLTHLKRLDKIAFVSESSVWKWLIALDSPFARLVGIKEKHFDLSDMDAAWSWIRGA